MLILQPVTAQRVRISRAPRTTRDLEQARRLRCSPVLNFVTQSIAALPFLRGIFRRADIVLAIAVCGIASLLIVPLPTAILDVFLSLNIAGAVLLLLIALFAKKALDVSTFPSLLLITTLFRLGLNVSTTRGILSKADAGHVVKAFGQFVVQGDFIVGMVIFLVITIVQFLVIAKGSERVAEVAARFTLDAMPGKQMSIDAALRNGAIDDDEAESKRKELGRESQMFGNMDGAMKFVKGDAIAGLIITALNVTAGFIIGVMRNGLEISEAMEVYSILTVGDGLVSQVSALFVTLAAGVLVTRVEAKDPKANLGVSMRGELLANSTALYIGAGLCLVLGLIPGLPFLPFLVIAVGLVGVGAVESLFRLQDAMEAATPAAKFEEQLDAKVKEAEKQKSVTDRLAPTVVPVAVDLDPKLSRKLGFETDEAPEGYNQLIDVFIPQLREALYLETGVQVPGIQVRPHNPTLPKGGFTVKIKDVPVLNSEINLDKVLAMATPKQLLRLGVDAEEGEHPINRSPVALISASDKAVVEASGISIWEPAGTIALHVASALRRRVQAFVGIHEMDTLVQRLEKAYPTLVREVVPKLVSLSQLVEITRRLVDEHVCVRDLKTILEALGEHAPYSDDSLFLTEQVRAALSEQIAYQYAGDKQRLHVLLLDPVIEETIAEAIVSGPTGTSLCMEPEMCASVIDAIVSAMGPMLEAGHRPVVLTASSIRRFVRRLLESEMPDASALSFEELPSDLVVQPVGRATAGELAA